MKNNVQYYAPLQYLDHTYTQRLFILYLKFRFNWASCIELAALSSHCSTALGNSYTSLPIPVICIYVQV